MATFRSTIQPVSKPPVGTQIQPLALALNPTNTGNSPTAVNVDPALGAPPTQTGVAPTQIGTGDINAGGGQNALGMAMAQTPGMGAPPSPRTTGASPYAMTDQNSERYSGGSGTGIGGVSATNPQAGAMDYNSLNPFIDSAYNQAMTRLNPQFDQQSDKFDQSMINRGIPVGSEGYNEARQQLDFDQNDARKSAAFGAMGFGTGIQNQMFGQDATRSGLANSLLQSKWGSDLGYAGLNERGRQYDLGFGEGQRRFDDTSNRAWDSQGFGQMMGLEGNQFRNRRYNDSRSDYGNSLLMAMLGYGGGQQPQWNADPNSPYNAQLGYNASTYGSQTGLYGDLFSAAGAAAGASSDARLKTNITKIGTLQGHNIYSWDWNETAKSLGINDPTIGVIAQEIDPAYTGMRHGYMTVDYGRLFNA